jgi:hypothetical protein
VLFSLDNILQPHLIVARSIAETHPREIQPNTSSAPLHCQARPPAIAASGSLHEIYVARAANMDFFPGRE